jgi:hypothetical protein
MRATQIHERRSFADSWQIANGVAPQIELGGEFKGADFKQFEGRRVLVLCEIEGGERELLDPDEYPTLRGFSVVVECHDVIDNGITDLLTKRFGPTHEITRLELLGRSVELPAWFRQLSHSDQLLAVWEWRSGPTPWLVMRPRQHPDVIAFSDC